MIKYNIEGLDQETLLKYDLDLLDAIIIRWFLDFIATQKMNFILVDNEIYYLVKYEAIIETYPILGINTTKGIAKRFEHYVEIGLMNKQVRRGGIYSGVAVFFNFNSIIQDFVYDKSKKIQAATKPSMFLDNEVQNCAPEESQEEQITEEISLNNSNSKEKAMVTTVPIGQETDGNHSSYRSEPQFLSTGTTVPIALNNTSVKNSLNNTSATTNQEAVVVLQEKLNNLFGSNVFSNDLIPKILKVLASFSVDSSLYTEFLDFTYKYCVQHCKNKDNLAGYFYKMVCQNVIVSNFLDSENKKQASQTLHNITCPVCGTVHSAYENCECCGLSNYKNQTEIDFRKKIFLLPDKSKIALYAEIDSLMSDNSNINDMQQIFKIRQQKEIIYHKYLNFSHEDYVKIF